MKINGPLSSGDRVPDQTLQRFRDRLEERGGPGLSREPIKPGPTSAEFVEIAQSFVGNNVQGGVLETLSKNRDGLAVDGEGDPANPADYGFFFDPGLAARIEERGDDPLGIKSRKKG